MKIIAKPSSFALAITSSSRILPPGCITTETPACAAASILSENGKNASLAIAESLSDNPSFSALAMAISEESTREVCPEPIPRVLPFLAYTIAFDFTCLPSRRIISL